MLSGGLPGRVPGVGVSGACEDAVDQKRLGWGGVPSARWRPRSLAGSSLQEWDGSQEEDLLQTTWQDPRRTVPWHGRGGEWKHPKPWLSQRLGQVPTRARTGPALPAGAQGQLSPCPPSPVTWLQTLCWVSEASLPGHVGSGGPIGERGIFSRGPTETGVAPEGPRAGQAGRAGRGARGVGQTHAPGSNRWVCGSQRARPQALPRPQPQAGSQLCSPTRPRSLSSESEARGRAGHTAQGVGGGGQGGAAPGGRPAPTCPLRQRDSSAVIPGPWGLVSIVLSLSHGHRNWNKS